MRGDAADERRADREWLGLDLKDGQADGTVELRDAHLTPYGRLYGGAGVALASAVIEAVTERRLLWVTTQFVAVCGAGDLLSLRADLVVPGRRTSQVRVCGYVGDTLVFQALGAAGDSRSDLPDHTVPERPDVPPPAECPELPLPVPLEQVRGFFSHVEQRDAGAGSHRWWLRVPGCPMTRPALLGLAGDCVPPMVMREMGEPGAGTSLDNTVRVGAPATGEWVLVDGVPEQSWGGYGHGAVRLWAEDGTLLGTASQTTALWRTLG